MERSQYYYKHDKYKRYLDDNNMYAKEKI